MIVAVPLFGQEVAPRFGFAERYLVAEIENETIVRAELVATEFRGWVNRLGELRDLGVDVILCGGFNRAFLPLAEDLGIRVLAGLTGDARRVVEKFSRGESLPVFPTGSRPPCWPGEAGEPMRGLGCDKRMNGRPRSGGKGRKNNSGEGGGAQPT